MNSKVIKNGLMGINKWEVILGDVLLAEADDVLDDKGVFDEIEIETERVGDSGFSCEECMIERELFCYHIEEFGINIVPSNTYIKDEDEEEDDWILDWTFFAFYDSKTNELLYEDSSSQEVGLYNLISGLEDHKNIDIDYIYNNVKCDVLVAC